MLCAWKMLLKTRPSLVLNMLGTLNTSPTPTKRAACSTGSAGPVHRPCRSAPAGPVVL